MSSMIYWLWFSTLKQLTSVQRDVLLAHFGEVKAIFQAEGRALRECGLSEEAVEEIRRQDTAEAQRIARRCREEDVRILTLQDAEYPERLRNIPDPPVVLYIKGKLPVLDAEAAIAVVGTRKTSPYGDKMSRNIAYGIAKGGGIVVTGLAEGADGAAAQGALMAGGIVIGVLGTGITEVFPAFHKELFEDVAATGALISEYPPDVRGSRSSFPQRNRIMAGLSLATVVTEAPLRSGALITAHRAADFGRDVFAVPGNADSPNSRGCNALLREGAYVAESALDILNHYEHLFADKLSWQDSLALPEERALPKKPAAKAEERQRKEQSAREETGKGFFKLRVPVRRKKTEEEPGEENSLLEEQLATLSANQLKIVGVMTKPSMHIDDIIDRTQLSAATVLAELTLLQIKGYVGQEPGKSFTLKIAKRG